MTCIAVITWEFTSLPTNSMEFHCINLTPQHSGCKFSDSIWTACTYRKICNSYGSWVEKTGFMFENIVNFTETIAPVNMQRRSILVAFGNLQWCTQNFVRKGVIVSRLSTDDLLSLLVNFSNNKIATEVSVGSLKFWYNIILHMNTV